MEITKDKIKMFYEAEGKRGDHQMNMYFSNSSPHSKRRFDIVKGALARFVSGKRFLEIGCAEGLYCQEAQRIGADLVVGLDISYPKILRCKRRERNTLYMVGDWDELPFADDEFDIILLTEGLEHSTEPEKVLRNTRVVAKTLILTVPLGLKLLDNPLGEKGDGHLHLFTEEKIKDLLIKKGYSIREAVNDGNYFYAICERK